MTEPTPDFLAENAKNPPDQFAENAKCSPIALAVEALEPFAGAWNKLRDPLPQGPFTMVVDAQDCCRAYRVLASLKAIRPAGEVRETIEEVIELRQWLDATRDERNFPAHLFGWCEEADSRLERLADALERQSTTPLPQQDAGSGGWKLVPVEPTEAMLKAAFVAMNETPSGTWKRMKAEGETPRRLSDVKMAPRYRAMLAAAPQPEPNVRRGQWKLPFSEALCDHPRRCSWPECVCRAAPPVPQPEPSEPEGFSAVGSRPEGRTPSRVSEAVCALTDHQRQLDQDGVEVGVSREALDVVLNPLKRLP